MTCSRKRKREMMTILYILLLLNTGGCSNDPIFDTKTVTVGQNVTLTCPRQRLSQSTNLFWIRLVSQTFPEVLGATISNDYEGVQKTNHITTKQEPGAFVLHITETQLRDTAVYYCIQQKQRNMTFLTGTFLRIKGPEPDITAVTQYIQSDPVHPGDPVTLQCSVLSDSETKTCPEDHRVYWFRAGSDPSHPAFIYAQRNSTEECEQSPEAPSVKKCVYSFSKDISSSDAGTYYCAVATCGQILFGNGTKLDTEVVSSWDLEKANTVLFLLSATLLLSLVIIAILIYSIKKKSSDGSNSVVSLPSNAETIRSAQQLTYEESLAYAAPTFTKRKAGKAQRRNARAAEEACIYSKVVFECQKTTV